MDTADTIEVDEDVIACDGGEGPLGHPVVYLHLDHDGRAVCPYCDRHFVRRPTGGAKAS